MSCIPTPRARTKRPASRASSPTRDGIPAGISDVHGMAPAARSAHTTSPPDSRDNPRLAGGYPLATADINQPSTIGQTAVPVGGAR